MIPAVSTLRRDGRSSFASLQKYLTVERKPGTKESIMRGEAILSGNLLSLDTAAMEMRDVAFENPRVSQPLMHFQLSWKRGEMPSEDQWLSSAKRSIDALGFGEHQYLIVPHEDKDHFHVHMMLNRVHPESAKAHNPRLSLLTLHRVARELEHEFGWSETEGLFRWDKERNQAVRNTRIEMNVIREKSEKSRTQTSAIGSRQDHFRDEPSLKAFASKQPAETLRRLLAGEANWQRVHMALSFHGLTIQKAERGGYTVGVEGAEVRVKASDVFRFAFSGKEARSRTEATLGAFESLRLDRAFDPPVIDYSREITPVQARRNTKAFWANHGSGWRMEGVQSPGRLSGAIRSIDDLPRMSDLRPVPSVQLDRLSIQEIAHGTPGVRSGVRLTFQPGNQPHTEPSTARKRPAQTSTELRQQRSEKEEQAGKERRQRRIEERARERLELKREFLAVTLSEKTALRQHTLSAKARRSELFKRSNRDKREIRSCKDPRWVKKAMRSVADAELLVAGQKLTKEITQERSALPRTSYEEWVERRAEAGDGRAAAQIRGWLYQDRRNLRKIDKLNGNVAGQLQPQNQPLAGRGSAVDWQELAHERLRQMKQQAAFRDAVKGMAWKADGATGDVVYRVGGVNALIDQGKKIVVLAPDKDATRVALQIAIHKYGSNIDASGTAEWEAELITAAVQDDVQVTFTDPKLQQRLIAARHPAEVSTTGLDRAKERFERFRDELAVRYGPGLDPTRADRLIVERMAGIGLQPEDIAGAVRELSVQGKATGSPVDDAYCQAIVAEAIWKVVREDKSSRTMDQSRGH